MDGREQDGEGRRLAALSELDLLNGGPFEDLDRLVRLAADICDANLAAFTIHDETLAYHVASTFHAADLMPRNACMSAVALEAGETIQVADAREDARFSRAGYVVGPPYVRSFLGAPLGAVPGLPVGVLAVGHTEPGRFGVREAGRFKKVAELVSAFLEQRRAAVLAMRAAATTEAERRRQHLFELIFEAIQEGVNVHEPGRGLIEANPACYAMLGLTHEEVMQRTYGDARWRAIWPDGSPCPPRDFPVLVTLRTGQAQQNVRMGLEAPSGEMRWLSVNTVPLQNRQTGETEFVVVTMKDITDQHLAEVRLTAQNAALSEALDQAERASRAKTDFMGMVSHELRTPMNAILGCALLLSQSRLDPVQRRTLGVLEDAGKQMLAVLNDLLDLSALNAEKIRIEREPVSMQRLIEDVVTIWTPDARAKGLSLSATVDPALTAPRLVDSARVLQVVGNLMANAVKFTSVGGVVLRAWAETTPEGTDCVAIEVEDTGPGVPREAAERIFQPFEQIDESSRRRHGGLGLGLHIARRLALAMGGDIDLSTRPGLGSRFVVRFEAPLCEEGEIEPVAPAVEAQTPRDVLCIDDNARNLFVLMKLLRAAGHQTTECASGREALELLGRRRFDVVLLDMVMPGIDGLELLARLRAEGGPNAATPVIACTANVQADQVKAYLDAGSDFVVAKPIDVKELLQAVANAGC